MRKCQNTFWEFKKSRGGIATSFEILSKEGIKYLSRLYTKRFKGKI